MKKSPLKTVVLLDAHAILHRGYHAMAGFATREGKPTGALYGFITMVLRIYEDIKPDYIAACFDLPKPTFRHLSYDGYKAGRQKTDDALITQIQEAYSLCEALCIPIYKEEGFEADDLLGTIAEQLKKQKDTRVIIASGDMDTFQLIDNDTVTVYTLKKANEAALFNSDSILERFGFLPEFIPDYKGLSGDPSDNIIGIKGIGDKTATELIKRYGTIEKMYEVLKRDRQVLLDAGFKERIVKLLEDGEEDALFSKTLATIRRDASSVYVEPKECWKDTLNVEKYQEMCDLYEFRSLRNRLQIVKGQEIKEQEDVSVAFHDLEEMRVMVNLLHSEMTNASFIDIQNVAKESEVEKVQEAHYYNFRRYAKSGSNS
jgi:DNA polymerase-1